MTRHAHLAARGTPTRGSAQDTAPAGAAPGDTAAKQQAGAAHRPRHAASGPAAKAGPAAEALEGPRWRSAARLLGLLRPSRGRMLGVVAATCAFVALNVTAPKLLGDATDVVVAWVEGAPFDEAKLAALLLAVAAMYVGASLFSWIHGSLTATAVQRLSYGLRGSVEAKLHRLPSSHFEHQQRGEVLSRATNDVDNISQALNQLLNQLILAVLMLLGALSMMLWLSPLLALVAVLTVPVSTLLTLLVTRNSREHFAAQWGSTGDLHTRLEEYFTGHEVIKAYSRQDAAAAEFKACNDRLKRASRRAQFVSGLVQPLMVFVANINYIAIAVVGAVQVTAGALTIGGILAFIQFSRLFSQPISQIGGLFSLLQSCLVSADRVFALLDSEEISPERPPARAGRERPAAGRVTFEDVSFGYGQGSSAVRDLSFTVEPGQSVAIVGHTGAGKTTIVNLLMRFYDPDSGRITVNGSNIAEMPRDELRSAFGVVLQDTWLFTGSIRDNIAYGRPGASDAEVIAAARACHVDQFVRSLPEGYATVLGNDGNTLSRGQRQLVSIARAQLSARSILVLDEATSSVDSRTEAQIREAMNRLRHGRTSLVIAHRLATVRDADLILVMEHGRIVEHGRHEQLLAGNGHYTALYNSEFHGRGGTPTSGAQTGGAQTGGAGADGKRA